MVLSAETAHHQPPHSTPPHRADAAQAADVINLLLHFLKRLCVVGGKLGMAETGIVRQLHLETFK